MKPPSKFISREKKEGGEAFGSDCLPRWPQDSGRALIGVVPGREPLSLYIEEEKRRRGVRKERMVILNVAAIKAPGFGERRKAILQDIAILTAGWKTQMSAWAPTLIVQKALVAPVALIAHNAGVEVEVVVEKIRDGEWEVGYNAMTDKFENLVEAGVIDHPAKVTRCALQNAALVTGGGERSVSLGEEDDPAKNLNFFI